MNVPPLLRDDVGRRYLSRLGWSDRPEPTAEALVALHRAHVERIPYETLWIALGERHSTDPHAAALRLTSGTGVGGYCYHLNGAFALLLQWLGFDVHRHLGGVQPNPSTAHPAPPAGATGNHLALTVSGVADHSGVVSDWMVDVGLGDGLHDPVPLVAGEISQGPFRFRLRPSEVEPGGWRFDHDPALSFAGFDVRPGPVRAEEFEERHQFLSTSPDSGFVRVVMAQRRDRSGVDSVKGRMLRRIGMVVEPARELADVREWRNVLDDLFGITLQDVDPARIDALWRRICSDHDAFVVSSP